MLLDKNGAEKFSGQPDTEALGDTQHNIHTTIEIGVKLHRKGCRTHPDRNAAVLFIVVKNFICQDRRPLGNDQFFEKSQEHPLHAERHIPVIQLVSGIHLFFHVAVFHDRAGNHRREVAAKQQQLSIVALYRSDFIIDIEQISQKGQRVE